MQAVIPFWYAREIFFCRAEDQLRSLTAMLDAAGGTAVVYIVIPTEYNI